MSPWLVVVLAHKAPLWTFVETEGVEPTNNHVGRELRASCADTQAQLPAPGDRGNLFARSLVGVDP